MQRIIIDAYNLLHADPELASLSDRDLEGARRGLIRRLSSYLRVKKVEVTLVFDGRELSPTGGPAPSRLRVIFSTPPESADDMILRMVEGEKNPRALVVVSSDGRVARSAGARGAKVVSAQEFWKIIVKGRGREDKEEEKPETPSPGEVDEWLRIFTRRPR